MSIRVLVDDVLALDQLAWLQVSGFVALVWFCAWVFYWLYRAAIKNGDVAVVAEQVLYTTETAASFHHDFIPSASHVGISEARRLPHIGEGRMS